MKITNKNYITTIRISALLLFIILITAALTKLDFATRAVLIIAAILLFVYALGVKYRVYEFSGECITFKKYSVFTKGYVRPYVEIPASYIRNCMVSRFLHTYYLSILIDNGISAPKMITLPLLWFKESDIVSIIRTIESVEKNRINDGLNESEI